MTTQASRILIGDVLDGLRSLADGSVHCCVTSPPYWGLRDYGVEGQIGLEATPDEFVARMVEVFGEVRRVLRDDASLWLNLGDSYASGSDRTTGRRDQGGVSESSTLGPCKNGLPNNSVIPQRSISVDHGLKPKDLCMMPWRVALALQADGWWLRSIIVWAKKSPMPESVTDRPTSSWEPIFLLTKSARYFYDAEAVKEANTTEPHAPGYVNGDAYAVGPMDRGGHSQREQPDRVWGGSGRNLRNVWHLGPEPYPEAHFATFPSEIPRRCIKAGTSEKGCCPACGASWGRVVERTKYEPEVVEVGVRNVDASRGDKVRKLSGKEYNEQASARTLGWRPSCECNAGEPVPCLVLDPFLGSGTTVAVARELGRHGVGCELNPEYAELARIRIGKAERPQTFVDPRRSPDSVLFPEARP